jgi:hypothetical protein
MRAAIATEPTADDIVEAFDTATTRQAYGAVLASIGDSSRFDDAERGAIARAMARCWGRVS